MRSDILSSREETSSILKEKQVLIKEKEAISIRQSVLDAFCVHFNLSESQIQTLNSATEAVNEEFFSALAHVREIYRDSQVLLGSDNQKLGFEILENSSRLLSSAYQKLYKWVLDEFQNVDFENPQIKPSLRKSLRVLAEKASLFQSCLASFAEARERKISDGFLEALTGSLTDSGTSNATNPIEYSAHDPLRYVGDMLAWIHSAAVSEKDALEVLFTADEDELARNFKSGAESEPWLQEGGEVVAFDGQEVLKDLVRRALDGVARLVRQRVEEVMHSNEDAIIAFKVANLIKFYEITVSKLLGEQSVLMEVLHNLENLALRHFSADMKDNVATMQSEDEVALTDLSPSESFEDALEMLKTLLASCETALTSLEDQKRKLALVFKNALDPFLTICEQRSEELNEPKSHVFALNCYFAVKDVLILYPLAEEKASIISQKVDDRAQKLAEYQHQHMLESSGLIKLHRVLADFIDSEEDLAKMSSLDILKPEALSTVSESSDDFLPSGFMDELETISRLRNATLAQAITKKAADMYCDDFEFIEKTLVAADARIAEIEGSESSTFRQYFPRTSDEVRVLLT